MHLNFVGELSALVRPVSSFDDLFLERLRWANELTRDSMKCNYRGKTQRKEQHCCDPDVDRAEKIFTPCINSHSMARVAFEDVQTIQLFMPMNPLIVAEEFIHVKIFSLSISYVREN